MPIYSHTSLSSYETCPLQYKLNYLDNIKRDEKGIEAFMGKIFHAAMEKLYKDLAFRVRTLEELLEYYAAEWDRQFNGNIVVVNKERSAADYRNTGKKCIENYYERYYPFDRARVLGLERQITIDVDGEGRYRLQGFIDRIDQTADGTYEIHDYKTAGYLPDQKKLDEDRQLGLYQIGVRGIWSDVERVRLVWHYVVFDKEMSSTRTPGQLEALKEDTIRLIGKIEAAKEFPPTESRLCDWCPYRDLCPAKRHLLRVADLPADEYRDEPGVKLAARYAELEREKSALHEKVKAVEAEQKKVAEAAIAFAEREGLTVIDGPGVRLKVEIKEELRAPTKSEDPKTWERLRAFLIREGKYEEVSTVNNNMLNYRLKTWPKELLEKMKDVLQCRILKTVRLFKKM